MKKYYALALLPLLVLSGCNSKDVKKPSFKKFSNEVSYEELLAAKTAALTGNKVFGGLEDVASFEQTTKVACKISGTQSDVSSGKKVTIGETNYAGDLSVKLGYDSASARAYYNGSRSITMVASEDYKRSVNETVSSDSKSYQIEGLVAEGATDPTVFIYNNKTMGSFDSELSSAYLPTFARIFAEASLLELDLLPNAASWVLYSDEEKANYKFYVDEDVFTMVFTAEGTTEEKSGDPEELVSSQTYKYYEVEQFVINADKLEYRAYSEYKDKTECYQDTSYFRKGYIDESSQVSSVESVLAVKESVNIAAKNPSAYRTGEEESLGNMYYNDLFDD